MKTFNTSIGEFQIDEARYIKKKGVPKKVETILKIMMAEKNIRILPPNTRPILEQQIRNTLLR